VGRNGTGKTTITKLITGEIKPDSGMVIYQQGINITLLSQEVPHDMQGSMFVIVSGAFGEEGNLISEYHIASSRLRHDYGATIIAKVADIHHKLKAKGTTCEGTFRRAGTFVFDEATNYLDINTIAWLEEFLLEFAAH